MPQQLSDIERTRVVELKTQGLSDRLAADILQAEGTPITHVTVNHIWNRWKSTKSFHPEVETRGRHSLYTDHDKQLLAVHVLKNRSVTAVELSQDRAINPKRATDRTFQNYLKSQGLESRVPPQHPVVNACHRSQRLNWSKARRDWGIERWQQICFTDESKLCPEKCGRSVVRLRKSEKCPPQYYRKREMYHGGLEIMVWGMISYQGDRVIVLIEGTLDGVGYLRMLKKEVKWKGLKEGTLSFQHDMAGPHRYIPAND